ncbi:MAG TPA: hypothetical protein VFW21_01455 [Mycobacterium sp.]|nr:hypothetical protein [Mycobacterium sp.]
MTSRALRGAAAAGAVAALISIVTSLAVPAGLVSDDSSPTWNSIDLVTDVLLVAGLAGFAASGAARGRLARIGLSLAFAGLTVFALAAVLGFSNASAGETLHPVSVPLTGIGMVAAGVATIRTGYWTGWRRLAPLLCGIVPFVVELPGFIAFGDSTILHFFIACTWTAWLSLFTALWITAAAVTPARSGGATTAVAVTAGPARTSATSAFGPTHRP